MTSFSSNLKIKIKSNLIKIKSQKFNKNNVEKPKTLKIKEYKGVISEFAYYYVDNISVVMVEQKSACDCGNQESYNSAGRRMR